MILPIPKSPISSSKFNITYNEVLDMSIENFSIWVKELRNEILQLWKEQNVPPYIGKSEEEIITSFQKLNSYDVNKFWVEDENYQTYLGFIKNFVKIGTSVNQFFPHMLKTIINGKSMYDWFSSDELLTDFMRVMVRTFRLDGMFSYSRYLDKSDGVDGIDSFLSFVENMDKSDGYFFEKSIQPMNKDMSSNVYLNLSDIDYLVSKKLIDDYVFRNTFNIISNEKVYGYRIRVYDKNQKIFPKLIQVFRLGLGQPPVNFPPLTSRFIYERFLKDIDQKKYTVYDPCSGWGGRLLGSLSSQLPIHYVGTDVNSNNFGCYERLGEFYNEKCNGENTYHIFRSGSEKISKVKEFQQYKNQLDLCFTSPPYFDREIYSLDKEQAINSYPNYEKWLNSFMYETMNTCYEYLKSDRKMLINISDIKVGNRFVPLEQDTISLALKLGFRYIGKMGMVMSRMVGLKTKDVKNNWFDMNTMTDYKVEPILVFEKT